MTQTKGKRDREALQKKYVVARASDIPDGGRVIVEVAGRSVGVFNVEGRFYAFLNRCPHRGAELCKGDILAKLDSPRPGEFVFDSSQKFLACPWHGWEFDLETGESWVSPHNMKARPFTLDVEKGEVVAGEVEAGRAVQPGEDASQWVDPKTHRIKGPYRADKLPLTVEDDYIVLSLRRHPAQAPAAAQQARPA